MFCRKADVLTRANYFWKFLTLSLALVVSAGLAQAQGGVGSTRGLPESAGGSHRIQGAVYLPDGRRAGPGIVIRLEGNVTGRKQTATDASGEFSFNGLPAADYSLSLDAGPDYEPLRTSVVIYGNNGNAGLSATGETTKVDAQLRAKAVPDAILFAGVLQPAVAEYKKAIESARANNHKKAVEELNSALTLHPNFALALSELGTQYGLLKDWAKLAETMEALLKLTPNDAKAHLNLGMALYNQQKYPEAEPHLREAVKLAAKDPMAHFYLGMTLIRVKQYGEAEKELELSVTNGGENIALAHKFLGGLYMSSKNPKAADELEKYLKLDPKAADADKIKTTIKELRSKKD